jgi:hypothetical protein
VSREGPPPIKNGEGAKILAATAPQYGVSLDAGAFRAVWEIVEAKAKQQSVGLEGGQALSRARDAFRSAYWGEVTIEEIAEATKSRKSTKPTKTRRVRRVRK